MNDEERPKWDTPNAINASNETHSRDIKVTEELQALELSPIKAAQELADAGRSWS